MDRETNQEHPSLLSKNNNILTTTDFSSTPKEESPRKLPVGTTASISIAAGSGSDRLKRDEWSEGAVSSLLEAYETKWVLRNRAKLKGQDWEDVARYVSSRANSTKSPKTQTQCKNKIESMKKRYRTESTAAEASSWPLYKRLDLLLRGNGATATQAAAPAPATPIATVVHHVPTPGIQADAPLCNQPFLLMEASPAEPNSSLPPITPAAHNPPNSHESNGVDKLAKEDELMTTKSSDHISDKNQVETDSSTPVICFDKGKLRNGKRKMKMEKSMKRHKKEEMEIADSIKWLAQVVIRSEQARMETIKEIERMRVEAEAKKGEMDLKRTEIIADTQLEIAKIFASVNKNVDSSLRIGRS